MTIPPEHNPEAVMFRIDALVLQLEQEGYAIPYILDELADYLDIANEIQ